LQEGVARVVCDKQIGHQAEDENSDNDRTSHRDTIGIDANAAVIFSDNFEAGDYMTKWDAGNNRSLLSLVDESDSSPVLGNRSLRAGADTRQYGGSGLIEWFPSADSVFIRFDVKFDEQSTGISHLVRLRANKGLTAKTKLEF